MANQNDVCGRFDEGGFRLVFMTAHLRITPIFATEVHKNLLLRQGQARSFLDAVCRLHNWNKQRSSLLIREEERFKLKRGLVHYPGGIQFELILTYQKRDGMKLLARIQPQK